MDTINVKVPQIGMSGEYRAVLRNEDESVIYDSGWQSNLITTRGEFLYGDRDGAGQTWDSRMYIGSSGATPQYSDTAMGSILAFSTTVTVSDPSTSYNGGPPNYERWQTKTFRFVAGVGTGTVRELGMGTNAGTNYLFSHHLLAAPIVKAGNNILDVSYRFTIWPSTIETTQSPILIDGVNYECKTSWYNLTQNDSPFTEYEALNVGKVYDGIKAAPTDLAPSGDEASGGTSGSDTFATGSQRMFSIYGLSNGNTISGIIKTATNRMSNSFHIQTEFNALDGPDIGGGIPKDGTKELTLIWTLTYGERP